MPSEYAPIPMSAQGAFERRDLSPGLFEFITGHHSKTFDSFPNALLDGTACRKKLHGGAGSFFHAFKDYEVNLAYNSLAAYASGGEDRIRHDKVPIRPIHDIPKEGTWWSNALKAPEQGECEEALMLSIIDGHGGGHVADLVQAYLHQCIAWAIQNDPAAVRGDDDAIMRAISDAYVSVSQDLSNTVMRAADKPEYTTDTKLVGMPSIAQAAIVAFERTGGACTATAIVHKGKLYAANLGDGRVVAIWKKDDKWTMEVMCHDHNGYNPAECERYVLTFTSERDKVKYRIKAAHPDENDVLKSIRDGLFYRLKGGLLPTRCIGDIAYNRSQKEREKLEFQVRAKDPMPQKTKMISPPYLEWTPEVVVHDAADLRFLVLATDGVWDKLSSKEAALGVIAHAQASSQVDVPWQDLEKTLPGGLEVLDPKFPSDEMDGYEKGAWLFEDVNAATFLVKNALCGGDRGLLRQMLSLTNGTRFFRDDMTAMVAAIQKTEKKAGNAE